MSYNDSKKFEYDNSFLDKLIVSMLLDKSFLFKAISLQVSKYIESQPHEWFSKFIIQFYIDYKSIPSLQTIKIKIEQIQQPLLKQSLTSTFITMIDCFEDDNLDFIKDTAIKFCRFQQLKMAITKSIDLLQLNDDYQQIYQLINQTRYKGLQNNTGVQYVDNYQERHSVKDENFIQTPWNLINNIIGGGLKRKKFAVVLAPLGTGKSFFLLNIAAKAISLGRKVVYYTLQMDQDQIGLRLDSLLLKQPQTYFHNPANLKQGKEQLQKYHNLLKIKQYLPNKTGVVQVQNHIKQLQLYENFNPDLIVIDYADILKKTGNGNNMYKEYGDVYTSLKALAKELNIPVWSASQGNRLSLQAEVVLGDQAAHSLGKLQIADLVVSIARTHQDKQSDTARFTIVKNRGGRDGMVYNGVVDYSIGKMQMYDNFTKNSVQVRQKMDNNSGLLKQKIRQRLINIKKENKQEN